MYRMVRHTPLSSGQKYGDIIRDGELSPATIQKFLTSGTLVRVSTPPLSELPQWEKRPELAALARANVITIEDLMRADENKLAKVIKKSARTIRQWQEEATQWLNPELPEEND